MQRTFLSLAGFAMLFSLILMPSQSAAVATALATPKPQTQTQPTTETFFGTILRNGENFVLSDSATKTRYILDDLQKARRFEGMTVRVTGTLDTSTNSIHVETIQQIF